jgi:hypothetical protein
MSVTNEATNVLAWRDGAVATFRYHKNLADRAVVQVSDDALRRALDEHANSIAVIMKHVAGNFALAVDRFSDQRRREAVAAP